MYIKKIVLSGFRNYESLELQFNKNVNIFLGKNAQGKTNLLESIYLTSIGKSFRTNRDSEMIGFGKDFARIYVETDRDGYDGSVEIVINSDSKKYVKVDGVKIGKYSELLKNVYTVIFSPEDLKIVKDEPEKRRKFIDRELCQIKPAYYDALSNYKKVLLERNAYLKEITVDPNVLDIWDIQLSKYGAKIIAERALFISKLNSISAGIHFSVTNSKENLKIEYEPNIPITGDGREAAAQKIEKELQDNFYEILRNSFDNDLRLRTTTRGPHKDDLQFFIDDINVRNFGSQGQQRTTALSLKLAELAIIKEETGDDAILLLDDVMSELDFERQEYLVKTLKDVQLFITTTELSDELLNKFPKSNIYHVLSGTVAIDL